MLSRDENAVICDFAEVYHVIDLRGLPARTAAALACGLPASSRIKMQMRGQKYTDEQLLLAIIADRIGVLAWQNTQDGHKNRNRPRSIYQMMTKGEAEAETYRSPEEYWAAREKLIKEAAKHG